MQDPNQLRAEFQNLLDEQTNFYRAKYLQYSKNQDRIDAERVRKKRTSLARAIMSMGSGGLDGAERAQLQDCATLAGVHFDAQRIFLPWALLKSHDDLELRDLTVANAGAAGYLVATSNGAMRDVLRGWSVALNAGVTVIDGLVGDMAVPRVTTSPSVSAISTEATAITDSQPVLAQTVLAPKVLACYCEFSRLLGKQANAEALVRMVMLSALGIFLDRQILNGSGAAGELLGLFNVAGTQTQSGTTLAHAGTTIMKKLSSEAGAMDQDLAFISTPAVRQLLENRERAAGNAGFVWDKGAVADLPAFASNECPAASMIVGPWPQLILGQWGPPGLILEINPFDPAGFKQGVIQARMILTADAAVLRPDAFIKSTLIT